jgi:hypothetical protein
MFSTSSTLRRSVPVASTKSSVSPATTSPMARELMIGGNDRIWPASSCSSGTSGLPCRMCAYSLPFGCCSRICARSSSSSMPSGTNFALFGSTIR